MQDENLYPIQEMNLKSAGWLYCRGCDKDWDFEGLIMVILKEKLGFVYEKAELETEAQILDRCLAGYRQTLSDNEIPDNEKWILRFKDLTLRSGGSCFKADVECGYENMKHLLLLSDIPPPVFAGNDDQALRAVKAIKEHRLRISEDIVIAGFDGLTINPFLEIPLATIRQPQYEIGRNACLSVSSPGTSDAEKSFCPAHNADSEPGMLLYPKGAL